MTDLPMLQPRSCGTCTKCCEGNLRAEIYGVEMKPGVPCRFVATGEGCTIYDDRPVAPCQTYKCMWLSNTEVPAWLKPSLSNCIIDTQTTDGISYMRVMEAGGKIPIEGLSWAIQFAIKNGKNIKWGINGTYFYIGSKEFSDQVERENLLGLTQDHIAAIIGG